MKDWFCLLDFLTVASRGADVPMAFRQIVIFKSLSIHVFMITRLKRSLNSCPGECSKVTLPVREHP